MDPSASPPEAGGAAAKQPAPRGGAFSDALIVAAAPAVAYVCAYSFEAGYASHFRIPLILVSVDLQVVLLAGATLLGLYSSIAWGVFFLADRLPFRTVKAAVSLLFWTLVVIALPVFAWALTRGHLVWRVFFLSFAALAVVGFFWGAVWPLLFRRSLGPGWVDRWEALERESSEREQRRRARRETVLRRFIDLVDPDRRYILHVLRLLLLLAGIYLVGALRATTETEFPVLRADPPLVALRRYGDLLVTAQLDTATKKLNGNLILLKLPTEMSTLWRLERLGRLSVETASATKPSGTPASQPHAPRRGRVAGRH